MSVPERPAHISPIEWHQSLGLARQVCARVFRDGGTPSDALKAFGLADAPDTTWDKAVARMAEAMTAGTPAGRRAA